MPNESQRKLAAILSADAVGYSRLMQADESATVETLNACRNVMRAVIEDHQGRVINAPGDALLAEFKSIVQAVTAAVEIQQSLERHNKELAPERQMHFRIGVNLGDVIEQDDGTIYGDGVNIAARMESLADSGGICVSSAVYDAVEGKLALGFDFMSEQKVKNISKPLRVYRVRSEGQANGARATAPKSGKWRWVAVAGFALFGAIVVIGVLRYAIFPAALVEEPIYELPEGPSIAVLPFNNMSGDSEQEFFSDGLTEQLIAELARYRGLYVIARNSTFQYKGRAVDVRQVGRELNVRYVLEGSVRRSDRTLRVTAQLLDASTGAHLWAESYDRALTGADMFELQDDIASNTVANIAGPHGEISRARLEESKGKAPESIDSYDCVRRAAAYVRILSPEGHGPVRDCLERAVQADPDYAEAWAWLAIIYEYEYEYGFNARPEMYDALDKALEAALRAAELDPNSAVVHTELIWIRFQRREFDAALASAERAVALNPYGLDTLCNAGLVTAYAGEWERGIALTRRAMALSPNYPGWCHFPAASFYYSTGEYEKALDESLRIEMPDFYWTQAFLAMSYGQLGRGEEASAAVSHLLKLYPGIASNFHREARKYNWSDDQIERFIDGLQKAGLDIPTE